MITFHQKGDFSRLSHFLKQKRKLDFSFLDKYGQKGVDALASVTPVNSGLTANSWRYEISNQNGEIVITFLNSNIHDGVSVAIILQYGHATGTGGWVVGRDYINPAIQPIFDEIASEAWKEAKRL